jgi:hypothetical protein
MSAYAESQFHSGQPGGAPAVPPGWAVRWDDRYQSWQVPQLCIPMGRLFSLYTVDTKTTMMINRFFVNVQTGVSQWEPPMSSHSPSPYHDSQPATYYPEDEALARRLQAEEDGYNAPAMPPRPQYAQSAAPPQNHHLQPPMAGAHGGLAPGYQQPYQSHSPSHSNVSSPGHSRPTSSHSYHSAGGTTSHMSSAGKLLGSSGKKKKEKKHGASSSIFKAMGKAIGESLSGDGSGGGGDGGGGGGDGGGGGAA